MEMEFISEFTEDMSRDQARQIIKRKRSKRQRPSSPLGDCLIDNSTPEISTEEDEDMANCLIMLAQSVSPIKEVKSDQIRQKTAKLNSRRFTEMTIATAGEKTGCFYAYECKTCNRSFPSFQALGGHRASHKKPKVNVEEKKISSLNILITPPLTEYSEEDHDQRKIVSEDEDNKSSIIISNKAKVHECSICGSEFTSGQALGGHMRKHRPIPASGNQTGSMMNTDDSFSDQIIKKSPGSSSDSSMLLLDLNFPPPELADDFQSEFQFSGGSSQRHLVFSAPALVDCHY